MSNPSLKDVLDELRATNPTLADKLEQALDYEYDVHMPDAFYGAAAADDDAAAGEGGENLRGPKLGSGCKVNVRYSHGCKPLG